MKNIILFSFLLFTKFAIAQESLIQGKIVTTDDQIINHASVFIANTTQGTSVNQNGYFKISSPSSSCKFMCKAVGYKTKYFCIDTVNQSAIKIALEKEVFDIHAQDVKNAKTIIKNAIKWKKFNNELYKKYSADVYVKSSESLVKAPDKFLKNNLKKILELDSTGKAVIYLSESCSRLHYQYPNSIKEDMYYQHVIGKEGGFDIKKVSDLKVNFYDNMISWPALSSQIFVSPIAQQALHFYNYKLEGILNENGQEIYKIAVIPKRKFDPTFSGYIYLLKNTYKIYALNLQLGKQANINFVDSLNLEQQYIYHDKNWLPTTVHFNFYGKVLGFAFESTLVGLYDNYNLKPNFTKRFFKNEILRVDSAINIKDTSYILSHRPIPLTKPEDDLVKNYYKKTDPQNEPTYLDSIANKQNSFKLIPYLFHGYKIKNFAKKFQITFDPLAPSLFYNTVEGVGINYGINIRKDVGFRSFVIRPEVRYAQQTKELNSDLSFNLTYDPFHRGSVKLNLGSAYRDLNPNGSLNTLNNSLNTLLFSQNFMKLFKKEYVSLSTGRELYSGLYFSTGIELARRYSLTNIDTINYKAIAKKNFTSNNPFDPLNNSKLFPDNTALNFSASLIYTINQKYSAIGNAKYYETPTCPRLILNYRKGISDIFNSSADYDFLELEIQQEKLNMGLFGYASFSLTGGKFLNQRKLFFPDYKHFAGNLTLIFNRDLKTFHFLDYYSYSTDNQFIEAHYEQNLNGYFTRKVPLLRKLKLQEVFGASYLSQPIKGNYTEVYFGFQRWYFRVNYAFAFSEQGKPRQGIRIFYGF